MLFLAHFHVRAEISITVQIRVPLDTEIIYYPCTRELQRTTREFCRALVIITEFTCQRCVFYAAHTGFTKHSILYLDECPIYMIR